MMTTIRIKHEKSHLTISSIYKPNEITKQENLDLRKQIAKTQNESNKENNYNIIGGDWNALLNPNEDKVRIANNITLEKETKTTPNNKMLEDITTQDNYNPLYDIWREKHPYPNKPNIPQYTNYTTDQINNTLTKTRIDYFLINNKLRPYIETAKIIEKSYTQTRNTESPN